MINPTDISLGDGVNAWNFKETQPCLGIRFYCEAMYGVVLFSASQKRSHYYRDNWSDREA